MQLQLAPQFLTRSGLVCPDDGHSLTDLDMPSLSPERAGQIHRLRQPPLVSVITNQFPGSLVRKRPLGVSGGGATSNGHKLIGFLKMELWSFPTVS